MKRVTLFIVLIVAIAALVVVNLIIGSVSIPVADVWRILFSSLSAQPSPQDEIWTNILLQSRLPQALTALVAGAGLAV
ncbi:MAG: iron chelate uptake ABC transporter family permease subunit, partial [Bacteroidaceae bacterium]|nr:iron chelate uptake ABC transporter family permease subunit [Bacteroidaceae bacterium]